LELGRVDGTGVQPNSGVLATVPQAPARMALGAAVMCNHRHEACGSRKRRSLRDSSTPVRQRV